MASPIPHSFEDDPRVIENPFFDAPPGEKEQALLEVARRATGTEDQVGRLLFDLSGADQDEQTVATQPTQEGQSQVRSILQLAEQGLLAPSQARSMISSRIEEELDLRQQARRAARDVRVLEQQFENGALDVQQVAGVQESLRGEYGEDVLSRISGWRRITGVSGAFQRQVQDTVQQWEQQNGVPGRWDPDKATVVPDSELQLAQLRQVNTEAMAAKPRLDAIKAQQEAARAEFELAMRQAEKFHQAQAKEDPAAAANQFLENSKTVFRNYQDRLRAAGVIPDGPQDVVSPQPASQPVASPQARHPQLPRGVNLAGEFDSVQGARAANPRPGSYIVVGGTLVRRRLDGTYERVQ